jgi:integrase/recombinase XerC/integrase/recombinase XerD
MDEHIEELDQRSLKQRIAELDVPVSRINGYLRATKRLLNWCREELIETGCDPRAIKLLRNREDNRRWLSDGQIRALLHNADSPKEQTVLMLLIGTGVRSGEARIIQQDDLSRLPVLQVTGKTGARTVMVPPVLHRQLRRFVRQDAGSPYIFSRTSEPPGRKHIYEVVRRVADRAGLKASPHDLRRYYATAYIRNGGSLIGLQTQLGHATLVMSRHYARVADPEVYQEGLDANPLVNL